MRVVTFNCVRFHVSQSKFHFAMETGVRSVQSMVDRDEDEMNGVLQAVVNVSQGANYVWNNERVPEQLYDFMGKLGDSFNIIRTDIFYVSASQLFIRSLFPIASSFVKLCLVTAVLAAGETCD